MGVSCGNFLNRIGYFMYQQWVYAHLMVMKKPRVLSPLSLALAAQMRAERAAADLTQTQLASKAGMGRTTLIRIEAGERDMDTTQLAGLCRALDLSLVEFISRAEERLAAGRVALDDVEASGQ